MADDIDSIQTWGKKVRYLGAAHSGTGAARIMHLTSVALIPLTIAFVWNLIAASQMDYAGARVYLGQPCPTILMLLFVGACLWHMKVGMQAIIDDYVHEHHLKDWALMANTFFAIVIGAACVYSLLKVSFVAG